MKKRLLLILCALLLMALPACHKASPTPAPTVPVDLPSPTNAPEPSPTPQRSLEPLQAELVLWAPDNADQALASALEGQLSSLAGTKGLRFARVNALSVAELGANVRLVLSLASGAELNALAGQAPQVRFVTADFSGATPVDNLLVLGRAVASSEQIAFLAGYALALITPDTRVGALTQAGTPEGALQQGAFITGARYFCGLCNAYYVPVLYYPYTAEISDPNNPADWQAAVDLLLAKSVTAIFVQKEVSSPELIAYLNAKGITLIGVDGQAGLDGAQRLVAVLSGGGDYAFLPAVEAILDGKNPAPSAGVNLTKINEDLFSPGRQILFERVRADLMQGLIKATP